MRAIGSALSTRSLKFRSELRLEPARRILEFSSSPRHMSQHGMQWLWSQYNESEHNHKQEFSAKTHDSPLSQALVAGNGGFYSDRFLFFSCHG